MAPATASPIATLLTGAPAGLQVTKSAASPGTLSASAGTLSVFRHVEWEHLAAGITGGVVSTLMLHPLDLVKIRFQVNEGVHATTQRPQYTGLVNAMTSIFRQQGVRGLYQGVTPNVWGAGAAWGFYFLWYNALKARKQGGDKSISLGAGDHMIAAAQSGLITLAITNPIWVAKTRLCLQYDHSLNVPAIKKYNGMLDCLVKTYRSEGIRGLYKGFVPGIFGVSHGALQFMAYEELKKLYNAYQEMPPNTKLGTMEYLCFAALSKIFAASITYPYQVVRARLQDQHRNYAGARDVLSQTYKFEGVRGFYKGIVPGVLRVTPACCVTFVVYEKMVQFLQRHSTE